MTNTTDYIEFRDAIFSHLTDKVQDKIKEKQEIVSNSLIQSPKDEDIENIKQLKILHNKRK